MRLTRRIEFDAGHRVIGHENKCKYLHGHRYVLEVSVSRDLLDELGRVIDFGAIKEKVGTWIDENLDHNVILDKRDQKLGENIASYTGQKIYYMENNPTAENIALHIKNDIFPKLFESEYFSSINIRLYETPNCSVEC